MVPISSSWNRMWGDHCMGISATVSIKPIYVNARVRAPAVSITDDISSGQLPGKSLIRMHSKAEFPSLGDDGCLYVDESAGIVYLWLADNLTYKPIASDWHQIGIINGGNA